MINFPYQLKQNLAGTGVGVLFLITQQDEACLNGDIACRHLEVVAVALLGQLDLLALAVEYNKLLDCVAVIGLDGQTNSVAFLRILIAYRYLAALVQTNRDMIGILILIIVVVIINAEHGDDLALLDQALTGQAVQVTGIAGSGLGSGLSQTQFSLTDMVGGADFAVFLAAALADSLGYAGSSAAGMTQSLDFLVGSVITSGAGLIRLIAVFGTGSFLALVRDRIMAQLIDVLSGGITADLTGVSLDTLYGTGRLSGNYAVIKDMTQLLDRSIGIAVAANGAGMSGISVLSTGGSGYYRIIVMRQFLNGITSVAVTANRAGISGVTLCSTGGSGYYRIIVMGQFLNGITSVAVTADRAGISGVTLSSTGGSGYYRIIVMASFSTGVSV